MEKEFVPYAEALALKELGFDNKTFKSYDTSVVLVDGKYLLDNWYDVSTVDEVKAPLYQQAFRWFREKYNLYGTIRYGNNEFDKSIYLFPCINGVIVGNDSFKTYEEAELECLKKLIEIVKNK